MKKNISLVLCFIFLVICLSCVLFACNDNDPNDNDPNDNKTTKLDMSYMEGLTIDLDNVTSLTISSLNSNTNGDFAKICSDDDVQMIPQSYIYSSTSYESGNVEYDETTIKKVTFKKNTKKTEMFYGPDGSIIDETTEIKQEDIPALLNRMYVCHNFMFMQYILPYDENNVFNDYEGDKCVRFDGEGVDSEWIYVRPNLLRYDLKGDSLYDKCSERGSRLSSCGAKLYYSSNFSQSFVMDLSTGYIYKLENISIRMISDDGYIFAYTDDEYENDSPGYAYSININNNNELEFEKIIKNDKLSGHVVKDKYDYYIVENNYIDEVDFENKIVYTTKYLYGKNNGEYLFADEYYYMGIPKYTYRNGKEITLNNNEITTDNYMFYKGKKVYDMYNIEGTVNSLIYDWNTLICQIDDLWYYYKIDFNGINDEPLCLSKKDFTLITDIKLYKDCGTSEGYFKQISDNVEVELEYRFHRETINGTQYYELVVNDGIPEFQLIQDIQYSNNIVVLQPINK